MRELEYFVFQYSTLGYMTKTLNQIIFFFLHQKQNIFFSNIGNQNILLEKTITPPLKLNGRSRTFEIFEQVIRYNLVWCSLRLIKPEAFYEKRKLYQNIYI